MVLPRKRNETGLPPARLARREFVSALVGSFLAAPSAAQTFRSVSAGATPGRMLVDPAKLRAEGISAVEGRRLALYTDLALTPAIEELPRAFELAFPAWCAYFGVDAKRHQDWRCTAVLIGDAERIRRAGLLPSELPPFRYGFARDTEIWFVNPPTDYYRRHLLLHEGVHAFMNTLLGSCGPTWYMEGIAEYLATHRWEAGRLELAYFPRQVEELPLWGRIRMVREDLRAGTFLSLEEILALRPRDNESVELYGWCWAAATFWDKHPRYQDAFRTLPAKVRWPDFNAHFRQAVGRYWEWAEEEWANFVHTLQFGHDIAREAIDLTPGRPLPPAGSQVTVSADRGWQNTGILLEAGKQYEIVAAGRYQLGQHPVIWWCEPGGVSIRYFRGKPLGMLLAAVWPGRKSDKPSKSCFADPVAVGLRTVLSPPETGTLFLRVNDSPAELADNQGMLTATIRLVEQGR